MKKTFFIFVFALSFTAQVKAENCMMPAHLSKSINELLGIMKDPCQEKLGSDLVSKKLNDEYCGCLLNKKNDIISDLNSSDLAQNPDLISQAKKSADKRKKRLDRLFRYLNYEVSLQEQKYGLVEKNNQVGCTANEMAETVNKSICTDPTTCLSKVETGSDDTTSTTLRAPASTISANYSFTLSNANASSFMIHKNETRPRAQKKQLEDAIKFMDASDLNSFLKDYSSRGYNSEDLSRIKIILEKNVSVLEKISSIDNVNWQANQRIVQDNIANNRRIPAIISPYQAALKYSMEMNVKGITDEFKDDHQNSIPGACINYDLFKVKASLPTDKLMTSWANKSDQELADSMLPINLKENEPLQKFLGRNPVLAKNMMSNGQRLKLAEALRGFASKNKNTPESLMSAKYGDFMRTTIKELNKGNEMGSLLQCDLLAQNYAVASNPEMDLALMSENRNEATQLVNNMQVCKVKVDSSKDRPEVPKLDEIVNANELFDVFDKAADANMYNPERDKDYHEFIDKNCDKSEMARLEKKYSEGVFTCMFQKDETCQKKARNAESKKRQKILAAYYQKYTGLGATVKGLEDSTTKMDLNQASNITNPSSQKQDVRDYYNKNVKPFVALRSMYQVSNSMGSPVGSNSSTGGLESPNIADALNKAQESYSSSHVSSQIASSGHESGASVSSSAGEASVSSAAPTQTASANPGQYIPPFLDTPKPTKAESSSPKVSSVDEARDVLEDMSDAPEEDKAELANQAKEYLDSQDQTNKEIAELQQKLSDYEHKKAVAPVADNTRVATRAPASVSFNAPTVSNKVVASGSQSFVSNTASPVSSGVAKLSSGSSVSKAAASYASALNQANETRADAISPSLVVENGALFDFNNSPVSRAAGDLVIGTSLEPSDKLYAEISSSPEAMKSYLAQNLKEVPLDKVVSIKCKGAGCNANSSEILLVITKGSDNKYSIRSVSRDTKVARSHRIQDLNNEIKKAVQ